MSLHLESLLDQSPSITTCSVLHTMACSIVLSCSLEPPVHFHQVAPTKKARHCSIHYCNNWISPWILMARKS
ncbi:hypothetical protein B0O80DRAFT_470254 [Mortierella sp. GBAus27b]|nr:hypothetical protein B0O80DRAFT_470254 [Mortierella sp. GBAus27b]